MPTEVNTPEARAESFWTVRNHYGKNWRPEEGWETHEQAEAAAKHYRREYRRRCVIVFGSPYNLNFADRLMNAVLSK